MIFLKTHGGKLKVETLSARLREALWRSKADLSAGAIAEEESAAQAGKEGDGSDFVIVWPAG